LSLKLAGIKLYAGDDWNSHEFCYKPRDSVRQKPGGGEWQSISGAARTKCQLAQMLHKNPLLPA
jgi:hypothetical protein